jgi:hypothetical protein
MLLDIWLHTLDVCSCYGGLNRPLTLFFYYRHNYILFELLRNDRLKLLQLCSCLLSE